MSDTSGAVSDTSGAPDPSSATSTRTGLPSGRPLCRYGGACRKLHDRAHCDKYDHPCKFGAKCRRQGHGCRYQHPEPGQQSMPLLDKLRPGRSHSRDIFLDGDFATNNTNDPERPVPYIFFLVCVCAAGLMVLPVLGGCNAARHQEIFYLGCVLCVPFLLLELLLHTRRAWMLEQFLSGDYSEKATYRRLSLLWYPDPLQIKRYITGAVAGNNIEQFATLETNNMNRDGGQVMRGTNGFDVDFPGEFSGSGVALDANGDLQLRSVRATFDGSFIFSDDGAWSKAGYWRLDWVTKVLLLFLTFGLECMFVAVAMPPGVYDLGERMPLNAVFLVDGSASIDSDMWRAQQIAGQSFTRHFQSAYGRKGGNLSIGIVQFSSEAHTEQPLTQDIPTVLAKFRDMQQMRENTYFDKALSLCKSNLHAPESQRESFDICVLITDGEDLSEENPAALQALVPRGTAIFGIFVGSNSKGKNLLKSITDCGKARASKDKCRSFAAADDYLALSSKAEEVASEVTHAVDLAMCAIKTALIGVPIVICMCLPYLLWYASCTGLAIWRRRNNNKTNKYNDYLARAPIEAEQAP